MLNQAINNVDIKRDFFTDRMKVYSALFEYADDIIKNIKVDIPNLLKNTVNLITSKKELGLQILSSFIETLKNINTEITPTSALVYKLDTFLESALHTGLRFGKEFKELYILPFSKDLQLHIAYPVFIKEVQRLFNIRLEFVLYHKNGLDAYNKDNGTANDLDYSAPIDLPLKYRGYQDFYSFNELIAIKAIETNTVTNDKRVTVYHTNEIIRTGAKKFFEKKLSGKKNCWGSHPTEMVYKTVVVQYIKIHFRDRAIDDRLKRIISIDDGLNMVN